jgi:hypothetical protein
MATKQNPGSTESGESEPRSGGSTSIPLSQVFRAVIRERLATPKGKAEMQRIGDKMAFAMMGRFH